MDTGLEDISQFKEYLPLLTQYSVKIAGALVMLIAGIWLAARLKSISIKAMTRSKVDATLTKFTGNLVKWAILVAVGIALLGMFGVQTTSFAAVIAASGLAIGLAFQGTLSNVAAGIMLLLFRPFKVEQTIQVANVLGKVYEIGLFSTTIDTFDNRRFILPNASIFGSTIENISHHSQRRIDVTIGVDYSADLDFTRKLLNEATTKVDEIALEPEPEVLLIELGSSSVDWSVRCWVPANRYWKVREALLVQIKKILDANHVGIPFPQMDVHLKKEP